MNPFSSLRQRARYHSIPEVRRCKNVEKKKTWETPEMKVFGSVQEITKQAIPQKEFGGSDGAAFMSQHVNWAS